MGVGGVAAVGGLLVCAVAVRRARPSLPGPTIVLLALAGSPSTWPVGVLAAAPAPAPGSPSPPYARRTGHDHARSPSEHAHVHGEDCGHLAVQHGDHVDYVHDGHRHAPHGEHYDEH